MTIRQCMLGFNAKLSAETCRVLREFECNNGERLRHVSVLTESGEVHYIVDSENTVMLRQVVLHSETVSDPDVRTRCGEKKKSAADETGPGPENTENSEKKEKQEKKPGLGKEEAMAVTSLALDEFRKSFKRYISGIMMKHSFGSLDEIADKDRNEKLLKISMAGGLPAVKAYLIRELFKNSSLKDRGFNIVLFLVSIIAIEDDGLKNKDENQYTLGLHLRILEDFIDYLESLGNRFAKKDLFEKIAESFLRQEYTELRKGGAGYYIKQFYDQELRDIQTRVVNDKNREYINSVYMRARRENVSMLSRNIVAYLKALAVIRLYANSTREERSQGDVNDTNTEKMIAGIIEYNEKIVIAAAGE